MSVVLADEKLQVTWKNESTGTVSFVRIGQPPATNNSAPAKESTFVGGWRQEVPESGLSQTWSVTNAQGVWAVRSVYFRDGKEAGSYDAKNIALANGKLDFDAVYSKKPVSTWLDSVHISARFVGEKLEATWRNQRGTGATTYVRTEQPSPAATANPTAAAQPKLRTWSDASGKFRVDAEFVALTADQITLRRSDGKEVTIPIAKLGPADQQYINDNLRK